jgi:hypothetical protein
VSRRDLLRRLPVAALTAAAPVTLGRLSPRAWFDGLIHIRTPHERRWEWALPVLAMAFAVRASIALTGDFVLHPDEIMQYLEPAHRLAFGNGVVFWEYFYGARSWLVPGAVAAVLKLFDIAGLGEPAWYIGGVKLLFCAISLVIPVGMYCFARRHFSETAARMALVAGAFWYELVAFAHKPLTEFVATAPLIGLLALCVRPADDRARAVWLAAGLAVLAAAIRMQYAPIALAMLAVVFVRTRSKLPLALSAAAAVVAVGIFDALTWNGDLFHSYVTNLRFNLIGGAALAGASPAYKLVSWFAIASGGLSVLSILIALRSWRRYGLLLGLIGLVLVTHAIPAHKEYRFIFVVTPLWLLIGADFVTQLVARASAKPTTRRLTAGLTGILFLVVSAAGVLQLLPGQTQAYRDWSSDASRYGYVRNQDPQFAAYRYLSGSPDVGAVWHVHQSYAFIPGYYYLHHKVPLYDVSTARSFNRDAQRISTAVTHIVSAPPYPEVPGYSLDRNFDGLRIMRRDALEPEVYEWLHYTPTIVFKVVLDAMQTIDPDAPTLPPEALIHTLVRE